jgi:hypothetical protein
MINSSEFFSTETFLSKLYLLKGTADSAPDTHKKLKNNKSNFVLILKSIVEVPVVEDLSGVKIPDKCPPRPLSAKPIPKFGQTTPLSGGPANGYNQFGKILTGGNVKKGYVKRGLTGCGLRKPGRNFSSGILKFFGLLTRSGLANPSKVPGKQNF